VQSIIDQMVITAPVASQVYKRNVKGSDPTGTSSCSPSNPIFLNLFLAYRERVVPTISASVSWRISVVIGSAWPSLPKFASRRRRSTGVGHLPWAVEFKSVVWCPTHTSESRVHRARTGSFSFLLSWLTLAGCHSACNFDPLSGGIGVQN
jgi:hypothetical protein